MKLAVVPIPPAAQTLTAYLIVKNAGNAIPFCKKAFEAKELMRIETPRGTVGHAELRLNDQMGSLSRPITIVTNGTVTYEGIVLPTVRTLLREARFRQDPRTLYQASLTINVPAGKQ